MEIIRLTCEARVGGETVTAWMEISPDAYADPEALGSAMKRLRMELVSMIAEKFPPKISAEHVSYPMWRAV